MNKLLTAFILMGLVIAATPLKAQIPSTPVISPENDPVGNPSQPESAHEKFMDYAEATVGPQALVTPLFPAALRMVNPPDAWPSVFSFYGPTEVGWGLNCKDYFAGTKWGDTDGFAWRHTNGANAAFVDGHAKFNQVNNAASGTSYNPQLSCTKVLVTDYSQYKWDPRYDSGAQK